MILNRSPETCSRFKNGNISVELYETATESFLQILVKVVQKC